MSQEYDDDQLDAAARAALSAAGEAPEAGDEIDIGVLMDYQQGALSDEEAAALEERLAHDPEARGLLLELGEAVPPFLSAWAARAVRPRRSMQTWGGAIVAFAMAAAIALFAISPAEFAAPPGYEISGVEGGIMEIRSDPEGAKESRVLDRESVLTITLAPADAGTEAAPPAQAFVVTPKGTLVAAPKGALVVGQGGALRFKARAADLFGEDYGARQVRIALGADAEHLAELAGKTFSEARGEIPSVRWLAVDVTYRKATP